jgi:hypothetical protein
MSFKLELPPPLIPVQPFLKGRVKPRAKPKARSTTFRKKDVDYQAEIITFRKAEAQLLSELEARPSASPARELILRKLLVAVRCLYHIAPKKPTFDEEALTKDVYARYQEWSLHERHRLDTGFDWHCLDKTRGLVGEWRTHEQQEQDQRKSMKLDLQDEKIEQAYARLTF